MLVNARTYPEMLDTEARISRASLPSDGLIREPAPELKFRANPGKSSELDFPGLARFNGMALT